MRIQPKNNTTNILRISYQSPPSSPIVPYTFKAIPILPSHISYQSKPYKQQQVRPQRNCSMSPKRKRRKIFGDNSAQKLNSNNIDRQTCRFNQNKQHQTVQYNQTFNNNTSFISDQQRINQINETLKKIRHKNTIESPKNIRKQQNKIEFQSLRTKVEQSSRIIKRQQQFLQQKFPQIQSQLKQNKIKIAQMNNILIQKLDKNNKNIQKLFVIVDAKNKQLIETKQQVQKVNSTLLYAQLELVRKKSIQKQQELQLLRLKRIEQLQNQNIKLYQNIKQQEKHQFEDFVIDSCIQSQQNNVWSNEQSAMRCENCSVIPYREQTSPDNSIGDILSPLAFSQQQYNY